MDRNEALADKLVAEWQTRAPYEALDAELRPADLAEAYRVQALVQRRHAARRGALAGRKIALSSQAMQQMVGIDHPVAGAFFADDIRRSPAEVSAGEFRHVGLECELAVTLGVDVAPQAIPHDAGSVRALIAKAQPAFELIEDRDADYGAIDVLALVADNAWCGGVVLGEEIADWRALDLADLPAVLHQEGCAPEPTNTGAADPLGSLAWVLNHAGARGTSVRAGEVIITGSVLRTRFPAAGDSFRYQIGDRAAVELRVT